jgi:CheY-like chemotaxis protein
MPTILVVDDEQVDRELIRHILHREGCTVLEASNYSQAVETFLQNQDKIDMLLVDVALPGTNGCELAKHLSSLRPDLAILLVSGYVGGEVCRQYGIPADSLHFLSKPFVGNALADRVREILSSPRKSPFQPVGDPDLKDPI